MRSIHMTTASLSDRHLPRSSHYRFQLLPRPPLTTFDRHIIRRLLTGYVFFVGSLIVFFVVLDYVEHIDDFMDRGAPMRDVFLVYYPSYVPEIVRLISPLALFLACIYLTGKLAQQLQITALKAGGVSIYRLLVPYLVVGLLITGFSFWFNGWVVPQSNRIVFDFQEQYLKQSVRQMEVSDLHRQNAPGSIMTVGFYDRESQIGHRISLQRFADGQRLVERIDAPRMTWVDSLGQWRLERPVVYAFTGDAETREERAQIDTTLQIYPRDLARTEKDVEQMTIPQAEEYVASLRRSGAGGLGIPLVGYHVKFAYPVANLILVLLGLPMAAVRRRGGQAVQIGIGLMVAFCYLALQKLTEPLGYTGTLDPLVTAWLPHGIFLVLAAALLVRARK